MVKVSKTLSRHSFRESRNFICVPKRGEFLPALPCRPTYVSSHSSSFAISRIALRFCTGLRTKSFQSSTSSPNFSFSISCQLFLLFLLHSSIWLNHLVLGASMGLISTNFISNALLDVPVCPFFLYIQTVLVVSLLNLTTISDPRLFSKNFVFNSSFLFLLPQSFPKHVESTSRISLLVFL